MVVSSCGAIDSECNSRPRLVPFSVHSCRQGRNSATLRFGRGGEGGGVFSGSGFLPLRKSLTISPLGGFVAVPTLVTFGLTGTAPRMIGFAVPGSRTAIARRYTSATNLLSARL